jgi:hypothetical protein
VAVIRAGFVGTIAGLGPSFAGKRGLITRSK